MGRPNLRLAVVIVSYNSGRVLGRCLAALDAALGHASLAAPADVVVVDNASNTPPGLSQYSSLRAHVVQMGYNAGFARAVNRGLEEVPLETTHVLLLNPDAFLYPNTLSSLLDISLEHDAALVGPMLVGWDGTPNGYSERPFHSVALEAKRQLLGVGPPQPAGGRALTTGRARCLTGACLLANADFLRTNGGLDTALPMYLEDVELCASAHRLHRPVVLAPNAKCVHVLGGSSEGANFGTNLTLHLLLLSARVEFVRRRSRTGAVVMRVLMATGALLRMAASAPRPAHRVALQKHYAVLRWEAVSRQPPAWPPGRAVTT